MCLISTASYQDPHYKFIAIGNRDEFYNRQTQALHFWEDEKLYAGKDLDAGGTWAALNKQGRYVALTNYRDLKSHDETKKSRGQIVKRLADNTTDIQSYLRRLKTDEYNPFNLLIWERDQLYYFSSLRRKIELVERGFASLSNAFLNRNSSEKSWWKVERIESKLSACLKEDLSNETLFSILQDTEKAPDHELPKTGLSKIWEKELSSIFIKGPNYGTRSSTIVKINYEDEIEISEFSYDDMKTQHFSFKPER